MAPLRQLQDMQNLLEQSSPQYQMPELFRQLELHGQMRELLVRPSIAKQIQEMLGGAPIASQAQRLMEEYFPRGFFSMSDEAWRSVMHMDVIADAAKHYEESLKPISLQQEWLEMLQRQVFGGLSAQDFARKIDEINPAFRAMEAAKRSLDRIWPTFRDIDFSSFKTSEEDEQEAERAAQTITQAATAQQSFQEAVQQIVTAIQAEQKPTVQLMLWLIFRRVMASLFAGAMGAVMGHYAPAILGESPQAAKKAVQDTARVAVGSPELLIEYRYVSAKVLIVRQNPKARSPAVGRLAFGKAVKLLKKDNGFALILWSDKESGAELQGWVFARHLGKFN